MALEGEELKRAAQRDRKLIYLRQNFPGFYTRGYKLNDREGVGGDVYLAEFKGEPVAVKMFDSWSGASEVRSFQGERNFLLDLKSKTTIEFDPQAARIVLPKTNVRVGFIQPVREIMSSPFCLHDVLVTKLANSGRLYERHLARTTSRYMADLAVPLSVHAAVWFGWIKMLGRLKQVYGIGMDSQTDDLAFVNLRTQTGHHLEVTKIDCVPVPIDQRSEREIVNQITDNVRELYEFTRGAPPLLKELTAKPTNYSQLEEAFITGMQKIDWKPMEQATQEYLAKRY